MGIPDTEPPGIPPFDPFPPHLTSSSVDDEDHGPPTSVTRGERSAVEAVAAALARIEADDAELRAFITVLDQSAHRRAVDLDAAFARDGPVGPLHGVILAVKDCIDVAGVPTTAGTQQPTGLPATRSARCVEILEGAGAIVIGKTNLHEWAYGATTDNPWHGRARNPVDPERIPGGSSGGSAIAVATGMAELALGTDTGGSIRIPAAFCGVTGLKMSHGRASLDGVEPLSWTLDTVGPIARDLQVLRAAYDQLRSSGQRYRRGPALSQRPPRLAMVSDVFGDARRMEPDIQQELRGVRDMVIDRGGAVVDLSLPELEQVTDAFFPIVLTEAAVVHAGARNARRSTYGDDIQAALATGEGIAAMDYVRALRWRSVLARGFDRALADVDAILAPVTPVLPPPHDRSSMRWPDGVEEPVIEALARYCLPASLAGLPTLSLPARRSAGSLPVGLQVIGRPGEDELILDIASWLDGAAHGSR